MDFGLSEEQEMLQETLRGFAGKECPTTRVRELFDAGAGHDPALWSGLAEMGVSGLAVPEAWGGAGLELLDVALAAEVLGWAGMPGPFLAHSIATQGVLSAGSDTDKAAILPDLASGGRIATVALQEGDQDWAPGAWKTRFGGGRVHGAKTIVPHAVIADDMLVGVEGGRLAWVDAKAGGVVIEDLGASTGRVRSPVCASTVRTRGCSRGRTWPASGRSTRLPSCSRPTPSGRRPA